jgi:hypothetical protein
MVLTSLKSDRQVRTIPLLLWPDPLLFEPYVARLWVGANFTPVHPQQPDRLHSRSGRQCISRQR